MKCSGNWMWPGKTGPEGAALVVACRAVCEAMAAVGVAIDGGKDSLSMCAQVAGEKGVLGFSLCLKPSATYLSSCSMLSFQVCHHKFITGY